MATVPISGTNIRLLSGVPFSNDYKHTRWFDNKSQQTAYFNSRPLVHSEREMNFQRIDGKLFVAINKSIDELWNAKYLMFQNASYNNKYFYAFVTKLEYKQKNTTYVHFQLDVIQTWMFDIDFKPSFVVREHCKLWNDDGTPVVNTIDEGLNYGTEYNIVSVENYRPHGDIAFLVIITKTKVHTSPGNTSDLNEITPTMNGVPTPLTTYIHPFNRYTGNCPDINIGGNGLGTTERIVDVLKSFTELENVATNVVSMYVTEFIGNEVTINQGTGEISLSPSKFEFALLSDNVNLNVTTVAVKNIALYIEASKTFNKYDSYVDVDESKLLMYPYTSLVLTDFKGSQIDLKNEYINTKDIRIVARGSLGTSNKCSYSVDNYLFGDNTSGRSIAQLNHALINSNPNDVPILSDYLSAYLQGNRNTIENQKDSIQFNGLINTVGSGLGMIGASQMKNPASAVLGASSSAVGVTQGLGNTVLQLQGIEAKLKDIDNMPPQLSSMGSNTNFDFGNDIGGVYLVKKQIKAEYRKKLSHFFKMFGYKINELKIPNFHTRQNWNYIQTSSCNINGDLNNEDLSEIKSVFDSGITLWHTNDVGNYNLDNGVL